MLGELLEKIEEVVKCIYTPEQVGIDKKVAEFVNAFAAYIEQEVDAKQVGAFNPILESLVTCYEKKAYVEMADILLYDISQQLVKC